MEYSETTIGSPTHMFKVFQNRGRQMHTQNSNKVYNTSINFTIFPCFSSHFFCSHLQHQFQLVSLPFQQWIGGLFQHWQSCAPSFSPSSQREAASLPRWFQASGEGWVHHRSPYLCPWSGHQSSSNVSCTKLWRSMCACMQVSRQWLTPCNPIHRTTPTAHSFSWKERAPLTMLSCTSVTIPKT